MGCSHAVDAGHQLGEGVVGVHRRLGSTGEGVGIGGAAIPTVGPGELGWFPTGDVGYLLDSELFLVDRARELIIVNGFNVYPAEVEEAIAELPGVESVAVVGRPYRRTGEQVVAFVTGPGLSVEAVNEYCADRLAKFKRPGLVQLVEELPRGITGKVRKGVLRHSLDAAQ